MGVKLDKKKAVSLKKISRYALIGIGWKVKEEPDNFMRGRRGAKKPEYDFDVSVFMTDENEKCVEAEDFIFYGNPDGTNMCVHHTGDDRTGDNADESGDNEQIQVDFSRIPDYVQKIIVVVTLYNGEIRKQKFMDASYAYIRVLSTNEFAATDGNEEVFYDLTKDLGYETGVIAAQIVRNGNGWDFIPVAEEFSGGLEAACARYGIEVDD